MTSFGLGRHIGRKTDLDTTKDRVLTEKGHRCRHTFTRLPQNDGSAELG